MASPKALEDWCRDTCASYPSVEIKNMSTSFRDGLAFCAIIHKHRPDLIDFSSLSKDNAFQNNKLAFDVAESKLGIPALLDPHDMVSSQAPDCLAVISYLFHYFHFFNGKSCAGPTKSWSPRVTVLNNLTKSKNSDGLNRMKSLTDLEAGGQDRFGNTRLRSVCSLCLKPVHLIQRRLENGKVYHRSCFRCKVCHNTLLPESYTQGSEPGFLICTDHIAADSKSTRVDLNQQIGSTDNKLQAGFHTLGGLAVSSVPHYPKKTESRDQPVLKILETGGTDKQEGGAENRSSSVGPPRPPQPIIKEVEQHGRRQQDSSPRAQVTEESSRPVPAPRRMLDSSVVPVPAPRIKTSQTMSNIRSTGSPPNQSKPSSPSRVSSSKVITNHPWINIVHPGPWTQLPPAPPPVPLPRSKSLSNVPGPRFRPKVPPPNPFEEEEEEETKEHSGKPADQTEAGVPVIHPENSRDQEIIQSEKESQHKLIPPQKPDRLKTGGVAEGEVVNEPKAVIDLLETCSEQHGNDSETPPSDEAQTQILPRSLSVPSVTSDNSETPPVTVGAPEGKESVSQSKPACRENPFDRKPAMTKSRTAQDLSSSRSPAPGHGFPLIKRKVQTDQNVSTEELEVQMRDVDKRLEALERRGVELERNLRGCKNDKDEEQMLKEWFSLIHERHILSRKDTELVYQTKQQKLEDRQADVEYALRCLLNKPESEWSSEDREREQQLMNELVAIIEQRNQIVSSLDQDRQREREEDILWESKMKNKDFQKERLKELKKSKAKFKPTKVFKLLNHKPDSIKEPTDKKK